MVLKTFNDEGSLQVMVIAMDRVALVTPDANCSTHLPQVGGLGRVEDPVIVENGIDRGLTDGVQ